MILYLLLTLSQAWSLSTCPGSPQTEGSGDIFWDNCIGTYNWTKGDFKGAQYEGEWKDDTKHGQGNYTYADGDKYVGEYKNDKMHGQGTYTYANGDKYVGEFKDNKMHGHGIGTFASGNQYVGEHKDDKFHGQGTYTFVDGEKYVGEWKDGNEHGQGTYTFVDGEKYVGEFKDNKYHGQGTLTFADGRVWQGQWKNDEWVSGEKYAAEEYNPPVKKNNNNKQNIDSNDIINAASGSGFVVSSSGHIVTNNHVINGCNEVKVHYNGEQYKASIISKDDYNDLALIKATFSPSTVFTIKNGNAELMEDIYVAGYPFGDLFNSSVKITKGIVSSLSGFQNNFSNMQIDAALQPGNSGGPVIDYQGNVVGVAVAKLDLIKFVELFNSVPENTNFAIKSSVLLNFLNSNGLKTKKASEQIMPRSELSEKITQGTLYLSCWMTYARIEEMKSQKVLFNNIIK